MTDTITAAEALRAYGAFHEASHGYHIEVKHPDTGNWVAVSGGTSWSDSDDIILGVFTGRVDTIYDEHGEHRCPNFTHIPEDGAIAAKANDILQVRNTRNNDRSTTP